MMKRKINSGTLSMYRMLLVSIFAAALFLQSCDDDNDSGTSNTGSYTVSGDANGSQVVPAVTGNGTGTFTGTYNPNTRVLNYTSNWNGLSGAPTSGGFYSGARGATGTAVGPAWTFDSNATGTGSRTGSITLTSEQETALTSGNMYYGYGTAANAGGEVRGQMSAVR